MKKIVADFFHRGLIGSSFGPLVLAVLYPILQQNQIKSIIRIAFTEICKGDFVK